MNCLAWCPRWLGSWGLVGWLLGLGWGLASLTAQQTPPGEQADLPRIAVTGTCMGPIRYNVLVVDAPANVTEAQLQESVQETLDRINDRMSTYQSDSDVSRFNRSRATDFVACDLETAQVVARALEISQASAGAFDITVGPIVNLWKFGPDKQNFELPDEASIQAARQKTGYRQLSVRLEPPGIRKATPELEIDLSAIAKGYAVDQVASALGSLECNNFMVEVGGEIMTAGHRQNRGPWRVGVEKPDQIHQIPDVVAELSDRAMATSGDYRNFRKVGDRRFSHTIDPTTGWPVNHGLASACVIADDCMTADALATAAMVMGMDRGQEFLKDQQAQFFLVSRQGDFGDQYMRRFSEDFPFVAGTRPDQETQPAASGSTAIWPAFVGAVLIFALVIAGMAVGAIFGNKPVRGSCGGLAAMPGADGESNCSICERPTTDCVERNETSAV